ncbi:hypothetical protein MYXO_03399 [Myxococcaceae bacterium]|jgi:hypothetical protein|nr:hypothetical protein MYXO_03399 [Myxococcaceae bacterium]
MSWLSLAFAVACGALAWTLLEYFLHRELGHRHTRNPFGAEHTLHHATTHYFAPSWKKAVAAVPVIGGFGILLSWPLGAPAAAAFATGLGAMYVAYEWVHRRAHTHAPKNAYGRWLRRHHFHHHFHAPSTNHGVTSPCFDVVFGTLDRPGVISVPEKHAMRWLLDDHGEIRAEHARDYRIVRRRRAASPRPAAQAIEKAPAEVRPAMSHTSPTGRSGGSPPATRALGPAARETAPRRLGSIS